MRILILFATTDGQTAKIARHALVTLSDLGHAVALVRAEDFGTLDVAAFDAVVVAGSLHAGGFQSSLGDVVAAHAAALSERPNIFLAVSLSAAGTDPTDWEGLQNCVDTFVQQTGWSPDRIEHIAGAFRFTEYDFFRYWAMRWIEFQKDNDATPGEDREYTDWEALEATLADWINFAETAQ